jgi:hypothetical protein
MDVELIKIINCSVVGHQRKTLGIQRGWLIQTSGIFQGNLPIFKLSAYSELCGRTPSRCVVDRFFV